ncbi:hypothetical protein RBA41_24195 [Massilia sp. CCM 9210]|uniref:hypothetical protein n=1 Tax=Massilia scottii TaxID=3057166 RepID=UPI0027966500|nr:hypothetical protein [Massilia sp. CCM 9210]MDQ1816403.1 hypothetical protein [Massilia sp. CCM 9210]
MKIAGYRSISNMKRLRVRLAWQRQRLRCFIDNPTFDFRFKLIAMSILSPVIPVGAGLLASYGLLAPKQAFVCYMAGALLGLLVLATLATRFIDRHFAEFKSAKIIGLALLGLATYYAHGQAAVEVNAIFQVDASSLPRATAAASALVLANWIYPAIVLPILFGSIALVLYYAGKAQRGNMAIAFAICMSSTLWAGLINYQAAPDRIRKSNLYQIALEMDFNKRSTCAGVPADAEGVVFIGPDQRRAIVAPRLAEIRRSPNAIFKEVKVPETFEKVDCT